MEQYWGKYFEGVYRMKNIIKKIGCSILYKTGLVRLASFDTRILAFHTVNPKYFEKQMKYLIKNYNVVPLSQVFSKNKKKVVLTFDDGYKNNLKYAYPVLKKYNIPATLFITKKFIDKNTFSWWDRLEYSGKREDLGYLKHEQPDEIEKEVFELTGSKEADHKPSKYDFMSWKDIKKIKDVFEIGNHTLTHPILTNISLKEAKKEILESKKKIEKKLGKKITSFAYPNGNYNENLMKIVEKSGCKYAVTYSKGKNTLMKRFCLHRRGINVKDDLAIFATKVAGL